MQVNLGHLRKLINEAIARSQAEQVATSIENAVGKTGSRVRASVDSFGGLSNVFVKFISGDVDMAEDTVLSTADSNGWSLLSKADHSGRTWWLEPRSNVKKPVPKTKLPTTFCTRNDSYVRTQSVLCNVCCICCLNVKRQRLHDAKDRC